MNLAAKLMSGLLIASLAFLPFPIQAGMIGTDQVAAHTAAQANRARLLAFVNRADVQQQMEAFGLAPAVAKDRVSALTDEEVARIAGKLDSIPAGASSTASAWVAAGVIVVAIALYLLWK